MSSSTIKTYSEQTRQEPFKSFSIVRMEDIYDVHQGQPDAPHRHDYYTVLLVQQAAGQHIIDFNSYELSACQAWFISPGQVHQIVEQERSLGHGMVFSSHFLVENNIPLSFIDDLNLFHDYGHTPALQLEAQPFAQLQQLCQQMEEWHHSSQPFRQRALGALMELFLITCNANCIVPFDNPHHHEAGHAILKNFKALVEEHYQQWHGTKPYAEALHITPDHLNRTIKSLIGKTAKEYLQSRITTAAKRMLYFTELSSKEIGYQLGFSEPGNFSAFFKKCTGSSPGQFRQG